MALRLATVPMGLGVLSLVVWLQVEWRPLIPIGYGCLAMGVLAALFVPFLLLRSWPEAPNVRNTVLVSALAVANVPVAFFCMVQGVTRATCLYVELRNDSSTEWHEVQLVGGGILENATTIARESTEHRQAWAKQDGRLELHYVEDDKPCRVIVSGYVTGGMGGQFTVTRDRAGIVTVKERGE